MSYKECPAYWCAPDSLAWRVPVWGSETMTELENRYEDEAYESARRQLQEFPTCPETGQEFRITALVKFHGQEKRASVRAHGFCRLHYRR